MVAPNALFSDANAGNIIVQAAQGILANQQRAQQLALQREQAKANLQLQFEAADARQKELEFRDRSITLQEEQLTLNKSLEGLRLQKLESEVEISQLRAKALRTGAPGEVLKPPEVRQRRLTARGRLQTNALNANWQQFLNDRPGATRTEVVNGRRVEVPLPGPAALTFKNPTDITDLILKLTDDAQPDPETAFILGQIAKGVDQGGIADSPFFKAQREAIQRTQVTLEALTEYQKRPEVQAILRGEGFDERQIQEELVRLFGGSLAPQAAAAEQRRGPDEVVAPTVDRADFFKGFAEGQVERAISLLTEGNPEIMARIIRGKLRGLNGQARFQELSKLRVLLENERPDDGAGLFKVLFNHLGGRALFDTSTGAIVPTTQGTGAQ